MLLQYLPSLLEGAQLTLGVALLSLAVAILLGLVGCFAKLSRQALFRWPANAYTTVIRGVPDLVLVLLVFYGVPVLINDLFARFEVDVVIDPPPFVAGVLTIGFIFGAYLTEAFRGAYLAVPPGQREAAMAYGMTPWQVAWRVQLPQMLRHALPGVSNNWLVLIKSTAIVSVIGLHDLMQRGGQAAGNTKEPFVFYGAVALIYLAFTTLSELAFKWLEKRYSIGTRQGVL
ncbi:MAG: ABC transporter permease [Burkholderiales bacterium]|uniref:ABC transporter permease n=1 Tax=Inhella sp. TaxID=1921806 RepID=UPI001AC2308B|nr:ABC transporter permease [Burkholderiales bacterium]